jgi:divalent metal cation (Fe/Co/Zn/Cd) transporter
VSERKRDDGSLLIARAIRLSWLSVVWAVVSGTASITIGAVDHSVAVFGVGLNLLGDLVGSLALIWRFVQTRRGADHEPSAERVARLVVGVALALVAAFLVMQSLAHLAARVGPSTGVGALAVAAASVVVLPPLARAKRAVGMAVGSRALRGDGTLSGVGAAIAALALAGLLVNRTLGWWWADSAAALTVALVAGAEARLLLGAGAATVVA